MGNPIIYRLGERALVLDPTPSAPISMALQRKLCWIADLCRDRQEIISAVPGMNNLTLTLSAMSHIPSWQQQLQQLWDEAESAQLSSQHHVIEVKYGGRYGADLDAVARHHQITTGEVIAYHTAPSYQVCFIGFMPGFAYLTGLDSRIATPRLASPRQNVPAGSVGIGGEQTGIYPAMSPGGWQLIGHCDIELFSPNHNPPSLLQPGDSLSFTALKPVSRGTDAAN